MESTSCLSTSPNSTSHGLQPHLSFDQSLPLGSTINNHSKKSYPSDHTYPWVLSHGTVNPLHRKRVAAAQQKMHKLYPATKYRSSLWSPELRFAMRAAGRSSQPVLTIQDLIRGKDVFRAGLSQLPEELFKKVYVAKRASRDCILGRLAASLREIDALEKTKDVIIEMYHRDDTELAAISEDLEIFKKEAETRGKSIDEDIAYRHAVYADEFLALTSANTQLDIMSRLGLEQLPTPPEAIEPTSVESEAVESECNGMESYGASNVEFERRRRWEGGIGLPMITCASCAFHEIVSL